MAYVNSDYGAVNRKEHVPTRHILDSVGLLAIIWNVTAFVVIRRAKKLPKVAKIFSLYLMASEMFTLLTSGLRRWVDNAVGRDICWTLCGCGVILNILIVTSMSIERLILFKYGIFYIKQVRRCRAHQAMIVIWSFVFISVPLLKYTVCHDQNGALVKECTATGMRTVLMPLLTSCFAISSGSYVQIGFLLHRELRDRNQRLLCRVNEGKRHYRTTLLMFLYLIGTFLFLVLVALNALWADENFYLTLGFDVSATITAACDATLYVAWYQECRMELLKLFVCVSSRLRQRVENMRVEVYNIVLLEDRPSTTADLRDARGT